MVNPIVGYEDKPAGKYEYWPMSLFLNVLDREKRDKKPLRNFGKYLPVNSAPYLKRRKSFEWYDAQFFFIYAHLPIMRLVTLLEINLQIQKQLF
jgi:hypothetical protein